MKTFNKKHIVLYSLGVVVCALIVACNAKGASSPRDSTNTQSSNKQYAKFQFTQKYYDFGVIKDGDTVRHTFVYKNVGTVPLIIHDISTSCGCTIVNWTKIPIKPGEQGTINVQFYKHHDFGRHTKLVIIKANTKELYSLLTIYASITDFAKDAKK